MWTCFCGMRLRTTGIIVGSLGIIITMMWITLIIYILATFKDTHLARSTPIIKAYLCDMMLLAVHLISSLLLIYGAVKEHPLLVLPWLVTTSILLTFSAISVIPGVLRKMPPCDQQTVIYISIAVLLILVFFYIVWYAIFSFYRELKEKCSASFMWQYQYNDAS